MESRIQGWSWLFLDACLPNLLLIISTFEKRSARAGMHTSKMHKVDFWGGGGHHALYEAGIYVYMLWLWPPQFVTIGFAATTFRDNWFCGHHISWQLIVWPPDFMTIDFVATAFRKNLLWSPHSVTIYCGHHMSWQLIVAGTFRDSWFWPPHFVIIQFVATTFRDDAPWVQHLMFLTFYAADPPIVYEEAFGGFMAGLSANVAQHLSRREPRGRGHF